MLRGSSKDGGIFYKDMMLQIMERSFRECYLYTRKEWKSSDNITTIFAKAENIIKEWKNTKEHNLAELDQNIAPDDIEASVQEDVHIEEESDNEFDEEAARLEELLLPYDQNISIDELNEAFEKVIEDSTDRPDISANIHISERANIISKSDTLNNVNTEKSTIVKVSIFHTRT